MTPQDLLERIRDICHEAETRNSDTAWDGYVLIEDVMHVVELAPTPSRVEVRVSCPPLTGYDLDRALERVRVVPAL